MSPNWLLRWVTDFYCSIKRNPELLNTWKNVWSSNSIDVWLEVILRTWLWLIDLFVWWHINLCRLFNAKPILLEERLGYYLTHSWEDKGVHNFPKGICPKVDVTARLESELAYNDSAVHRFNHYTTRTPPNIVFIWQKKLHDWMILEVIGYLPVCPWVWWKAIELEVNLKPRLSLDGFSQVTETILEIRSGPMV